MGVLLGHVDFSAVVYGLLMFAGLAVLFYKLVNFSWLSLSIDIAVFWLVFKLHGGTMQGGFAAMICALCAGIVFPWMLRRMF
jgi:hypothetical protein